jgi:hypothetical protein
MSLQDDEEDDLSENDDEEESDDDVHVPIHLCERCANWCRMTRPNQSKRLPSASKAKWSIGFGFSYKYLGCHTVDLLHATSTSASTSCLDSLGKKFARHRSLHMHCVFPSP